jgi:hypothetical protein
MLQIFPEGAKKEYLQLCPPSEAREFGKIDSGGSKMYLQFDDGLQCIIDYYTADGRRHEFRGIADEFFAQHRDKMCSYRLGNVVLLFGGAEREK